MQENSVKKKWNLTGKGPSWSSGTEIQENIDRVGRLSLLLVGIHSSQGRMWGCLNNHQISRLEIFLIFNLEMALQHSSLRCSWLLSSTLSLSEDFQLKARVTKRPVCPNVGGEWVVFFCYSCQLSWHNLHPCQSLLIISRLDWHLLFAMVNPSSSASGFSFKGPLLIVNGSKLALFPT